MHAYQPKGKRSYSIRLPEPATCLEALELRRARLNAGTGDVGTDSLRAAPPASDPSSWEAMADEE